MKTLRIVVYAFVAICLFAGIALAVESKSSTVSPPNLSGTSMWVPWADFKELLDKLDAASVPDPPPPPPFDAVVSSASYDVKVGASTVVATISAEVMVLKEKGWASVPIVQQGIPIASALLDGRPTALTKANDGKLHLLVRGAKTHTLTLVVELPLTTNSGPEQFALPTVLAQVNRLSVRIGKPNLQVMLRPKGQLVSTTNGGATVAKGSFAPTPEVTVSWARSAPKAVKETARILAEVRTMLTVGEGLAVYTAIVDFDIQHKPVSEFSMLLPPDVSVADVSTQGLVDWKVEKTDQGQQLAVSIAFEAVGRHQVAVTYEKALESGDDVLLETPNLRVLNVVHEVGYLAVAVRSNIQVNLKDGGLTNLAQLDSGELPADLRGAGDQKVLFGFKYIKHPSVLGLQVITHKDASVLTCEVEQASYKIMLTDRGKELIEATYRIANRSLQYLTLTLPEGADLWGVYRDGEPIKAAEKDGKILLPIFQGGMNKTFTMKVLAYKKAGSFHLLGRKKVDLPMLDVGAGKVYLELYLPTRFQYHGFKGKLRRTHQGPPELKPVSKIDADGYVGAGKKDKGWYDQGEDVSVNDNRRYRYERSQVQQNIVNAPVTASNEAYNPSMARGTLPVTFDVKWEGRVHRFTTSIVDPAESIGLRFMYGKKNRSFTAWLLVFLASIFIGIFAVRAVLARRSELNITIKPGEKKIMAAAVVMIVALSPFMGDVMPIVVMGVIGGAAITLLLAILTKIRMDREAKQEQAVKSPPIPEATPVDESKDEGGES